MRLVIVHGEWKVRQLADWVNLNFPLGMPEAEIIKAADSGKEDAGVRFGVRRASARRNSPSAISSPTKFARLTMSKSASKTRRNSRWSSAITILSAIDKLWQEHLYEMDSLRYSIGLRGYGQRDPLVEYKAEAYQDFRRVDGQREDARSATTSSAARPP